MKRSTRLVLLVEVLIEAIAGGTDQASDQATDQASDQATDQASDQADAQISEPVRQLLAVMDEAWWTAQELMAALGLSHRPTFRKNYP